MITKGQFIEISYTGKLHNGAVFDTRDESLAKTHGIFNQSRTYGPVVICVGEGNVLAGLDTALVGKELNKSYTFEFTPDQAFGKKNASLIRLVPLKKFHEQRVNPTPGMSVYIDNTMGTVKTVSGGRTLVDFNHPLAGLDVIYDVTIGAEVTDTAKQLDALLLLQFGKTKSTVDASGNAVVVFPVKMPQDYATLIEKQIKKLIPKITSLKLEFPLSKSEQQQSQSPKV